MNQLINFVLKNKFAVWLITTIITAAGLYSGLSMKLETLPNITPPIVTVTTIYPGATPEEVANSVSEPIEKQLQNLNGVKTVSSTSFQNASSVQVEYSFSTDMEKAEQEAAEALADLDFPKNVQEPDVSRLSINAFPIMALSLSDKDLSLSELTAVAEKNIVPELEGLEGVATVQMSGQQIEQASVVFNKEKLAQLKLDEETVTQMIQASDLVAPLGLFTFGDTEKSVMIDGNITTLEDLKNLPIGPMTLSDIATIKFAGKAESISRTNGQESIGLQIVKAADANTVDVANEVKEKVTQFKSDIDGLTITTTFDQGGPIEESVKTMLSKALFGAIFAVIIILLFLRDVRSTIISVISIPLSILIALILLKQMDITLNIMTLGAMTVAIGRVIDDSIVVVENIYRRLALKEEKLKGKELIREATKEMFLPIMSSTLVTIAVFLPLGLVDGPVGELFLPFALTVVFALSASLLVAVTIVPMLAHTMFKRGVKTKNHEEKPGLLAAKYRSLLNWTLNHKIITFLTAILLLAGSFFLVPKIGVSFLPGEEEKMVVVTYSPEPGQTQEEVAEIALETETYFMNKTDVKTVQYSVGSANPMSPGQTNSAMFYVIYKDETKNFTEKKDNVIVDLQESAKNGKWATQDFSASAGSNEIAVNIFGDNISDIEPLVSDVEEMMNKSGDFKKVETSLADSYEEYTLKADQKKLAAAGLTAGQVAMKLSPVREKPILTTVEKDGKDLNVYVEVPVQNYKSIDSITSQSIQTNTGQTVTIGDVMNVEEGKTSDTISRRDRKVFVDVSGELKGEDVSAASASLQKKLDALELPPGTDVELGGVTQDINESFTQLGLAMLAAVAIVYLILVITFGGGLAPLAILFSLPFTIIGALVALLIAGETISISSMIGALMLIGIVVTNAIVLIDRVIHKEQEGFSTREALLEAGATRLRPILMTALATIGALLPLALGFEGGGLISKGLGVTVIGGLTSSTLLTLIIVPIVYEVLMKRKKKKA
ncbi:HAE1 family hydrophobic/amphiphilic exporter-1 [Bacillus ectoiniformans]|uniref:efflux RND transporter permease subunit n=1 Tax=Bacillus ectoiniformans TaxID=1494429 RepID=UPI00195842A2|nr:efflux RND transporter permease subunit [Bacillus ectoiniformans]MBM7648588.1 HAE1 family hydrophobic/amphiphilic exporter-1 [Bacillus ectoiniformans]